MTEESENPWLQALELDDEMMGLIADIGDLRISAIESEMLERPSFKNWVCDNLYPRFSTSWSMWNPMGAYSSKEALQPASLRALGYTLPSTVQWRMPQDLLCSLPSGLEAEYGTFDTLSMMKIVSSYGPKVDFTDHLSMTPTEALFREWVKFLKEEQANLISTDPNCEL